MNNNHGKHPRDSGLVGLIFIVALFGIFAYAFVSNGALDRAMGGDISGYTRTYTRASGSNPYVYGGGGINFQGLVGSINAQDFARSVADWVSAKVDGTLEYNGIPVRIVGIPTMWIVIAIGAWITKPWKSLFKRKAR